MPLSRLHVCSVDADGGSPNTNLVVVLRLLCGVGREGGGCFAIFQLLLGKSRGAYVALASGRTPRGLFILLMRLPLGSLSLSKSWPGEKGEGDEFDVFFQ